MWAAKLITTKKQHMKKLKSFSEVIEFFDWKTLDKLTPYSATDSYISEELTKRYIDSIIQKMVGNLHKNVDKRGQIVFKSLGRDSVVNRLKNYVIEYESEVKKGVNDRFTAVEKHLSKMFKEINTAPIERHIALSLTIATKSDLYLDKYKSKYPNGKTSFVPAYVRMLEMKNGVLKLDASSKFSIQEFKDFYGFGEEVREAKPSTTNFMYLSGQKGINKIIEVFDKNDIQYLVIEK